ncbi:MAG: DUF3696 domain-containing protein [Lutibacter sp.]
MEYLQIINFKCFYDIDVPLNQLTIFAGANGNGKSTAIQALLFLRRTIEHCGKWESGELNRYSYSETNGLNVELNGSYCLALGNSSIVLPRDSSKTNISLGLFNSETKEEFITEYETNGESHLWLTPVKVSDQANFSQSIFRQEFYYLNAERVGPRIKQSITFYDFPSTGFQGEYVAQLIGDTEFNYKFKVNENRRNVKSDSPYLEQQLNAWLDFIMPGVSVKASYDLETLSAQIRINNDYTRGEHTIAPNIGFGISYILPIIVSGLIAKESTYLIVENPEAHLHPSAQSRIGVFLAMIAKSGVKVIVETHSDHFINGVQIAAAKKEISNELITINFFNQDAHSLQPDVLPISINSKGELSHWPKGFFDQNQMDYASLLKIRRNE